MSDKPQTQASPDIDEGLLPFVVELWTEDESEVESVLARVQSASLGQAVLNASRADFPVRFLTLRRGAKIVADTSTNGTPQRS